MNEEITWEEVKIRLNKLTEDITTLTKKIEKNNKQWQEYLISDSHKEFLELSKKISEFASIGDNE